MVFDKAFLDSLTYKAKQSERLRQHFDLRNSEEDTNQLILNAIEPGTTIKIHKHPTTSTLTLLLRGRARVNIFDDNANKVKQILLSPNDIMAYTVLENEWHNIESLESGTVIFEQKSGKYDPVTDAIFL